MTRYAQGTEVNVGSTKNEIERLLMKRNASGFASGWSGNTASVQFDAHGRRVRFKVQLPDRDERRFTDTPSGKWARSDDDAYKAWEQEVKRLWRCMLLTIKSKLTSADEGIETFEEAFMAQIVLPDGTTIADKVSPQLNEMYNTNKMLPLLD